MKMHSPDSALKSPTRLLAEATTRVLPSGEKAAALATPFSAIRATVQEPLAVCQTRSVPSTDVVSARSRSSEKAAALRGRAWRRTRPQPPAASQVRAVPSTEAVRSAAPSAENSEETTEPVCPARVSRREAVRASQRQAVASSEAVTSSEPSGEKRTHRTTLAWPRKVRTQAPVSAHQTLAALSSEVPATHAPSEETVHDATLPLSSQRSSPVSSHQTLASAREDTVRSSLPSGESTVERTGSARVSGAMEAKVLSKEQARQHSGVCTTKTASPSEMPDSSKVECASRT
mmetsp:Transcript_107569/g.286251  ORF Transcript_107569/g.286251 Transcript_107569/m.286251 type:complete len:289 (+) Transcript_107569:310-1176(+)